RPINRAVVYEQPDQECQVRVAVEYRVEEAAETGYLVRRARYTSIDHVTQAGENDDESGSSESSERKERRCDDVDDESAKGENVWINLGERQSPHKQPYYFICNKANRAGVGHNCSKLGCRRVMDSR